MAASGAAGPAGLGIGDLRSKLAPMITPSPAAPRRGPLPGGGP